MHFGFVDLATGSLVIQYNMFLQTVELSFVGSLASYGDFRLFD